MCRRVSFSSARAFTLIEMLAAVAILGALVAILLPSLSAVRTAADGGRCVANLHNMAMAFKTYAQENDGYLPAPRYANPGTPTSNPNPQGSTWQMELAPYTTGPLRANNIYRLKEVPIGQNTQICPTYLKMFPSQTAMRDSGLNAAGYGMNINLNVGGQDINFGGRIYNRFKEIGIMRPATSILVGDSADYHIDCRTGTWQYTSPTATKPDGCNSGAPKRHNGKANYLFADGHVETLTPETALPLLRFNP